MLEAGKEEWDAFISHASEDKDRFVRPLASALVSLGVRVWYDEFSLKVGDSLSASIDRGLEKSRYGIVVISRSFMNKEWPKHELRGLVTREIDGQSRVLPIWHDVTRIEVAEFSPTLADKLAVRTSEGSAIDIALQILEQVRPDIYRQHSRSQLVRLANGEAVAEIERQQSAAAAEFRHAMRAELSGLLGHLLVSMEVYDHGLAAHQQGMTEEALNRLFGARFRKSLQRVRLSGEQLNNVLECNTLLPIGGSFHIQRSRVDVARMLRELRSVFLPELNRRQLSIEMSGVGDVFALSDGRMLRLAIFNLLDNAVKFSFSGNTIKVGTAADRSNIAVSVENVGPHIRPDLCEVIFQPFWRAQYPGMQPMPGIGQGLPVARMIAHAHGGDIKVESHPLDDASCDEPTARIVFTLRIPVEGNSDA